MHAQIPILEHHRWSGAHVAAVSRVMSRRPGLPLVLAGLFMLTSGAGLAQVNCGDFIAVDTKLTSNLTCSGPGSALVIVEDGVTLNLNGFVIDGPSGSIGGIVVLDSANVRIKGPGVVKEFITGVLVVGGSNNRVENIIATGNTVTGIRIEDSSDNRISGNIAYGNGVSGIALTTFGSRPIPTDRTVVDGNEIYANGQTGIAISNAGIDNSIAGNLVHDEVRGIQIAFQSDALVKENRLSGNDAAVVIINNSSENTVIENFITNNELGVQILTLSGSLGNDDNVITGNLFTNNRTAVQIHAGSGASNLDNEGNQIVENTFVLNLTNIGFGTSGPPGVGTVLDPNNVFPP